MWKPLVAQVCKPLLQPALLGPGQRCGASDRGDRVPVGLGRAGAPRSDEEVVGERPSPNGSSRAGFWHSALRGGTVGLFPLWNPPSHTHHHPVLSPAPSLTPSEPLSSSPSLPASVSPAGGQRWSPPVAIPTPEPDSPTWHILTGPGSGQQSPSMPRGPALPSAPGQSRPSGSKRVRVGAGLGRGRPRPPEPPPAAPIPVRPAPRHSGITPPSPACPGPALPLLPSEQPCCDMPCRAVPCRFAIPCPYTTPCFLTLLPVHPQLPSTPQSPGSRLGS